MGQIPWHKLSPADLQKVPTAAHFDPVMRTPQVHGFDARETCPQTVSLRPPETTARTLVDQTHDRVETDYVLLSDVGCGVVRLTVLPGLTLGMQNRWFGAFLGEGWMFRPSHRNALDDARSDEACSNRTVQQPKFAGAISVTAAIPSTRTDAPVTDQAVPAAQDGVKTCAPRQPQHAAHTKRDGSRHRADGERVRDASARQTA